MRSCSSTAARSPLPRRPGGTRTPRSPLWDGRWVPSAGPPQPGSIRKALITLVVGLVITFAVGTLLVAIFPGGLQGPTGRIAWIARRIGIGLVAGDASALNAPVSAPPGWINTIIGIMVGLTLLATVVALMRSQRRAALVSAEDEPRIRALVAE